MTFEEFFTKKRIDLALLRSAKPNLYEEFRRHYTQMGEKSFDHTKKYWFNRLRKEFLLEVTEVQKKVLPAVTGNKGVTSGNMDAKPEGLSSMSSSGFKPRFKAGTTPAVAKPMENLTEAPESSETKKAEVATGDKSNAPTTKPAGFKPRFKPGVTASAKSTASPAADGGGTQSNTQPAAEPTSQAKSIGFKPRFKAGVTPVKKPDIDERPDPDAPNPTTESAIEATSKPLGFRPRFKAGKATGKKDDTDI